MLILTLILYNIDGAFNASFFHQNTYKYKSIQKFLYNFFELLRKLIMPYKWFCIPNYQVLINIHSLVKTKYSMSINQHIKPIPKNERQNKSPF
jgi:hypothetical protein